MNFLTKVDVVAMAPARWARQYDNGRSSEAHTAITAKLKALEHGFTAEQVEAIIGNVSWTTIKCDECRQNVEAVAQFAEWKDDGGGADLCTGCLAKALEAFKP